MQNRIYYADILRISAILCVVIGHILSQPFQDPFSYVFWTADIINSFLQWCIIAFFMISGMLLLSSSKNESLKAFYGKRIPKLLVPLVAWSIIYYLAKLLHALITHSARTFSISDFINDFISASISFPLWFLYVMIIIYLIAPLLRIYVKKTSMKHMAYHIGFMIIVMQVYVFLLYNYNLSFSWPVSALILALFFVVFFVLGYILNKVDIDKKYLRILYPLAIIGWFATIFIVYFNIKENVVKNEIQSIFYEHFPLTNIVLAVGIFVACKNYNWGKIFSNNPTAQRLLAKASAVSFGVYLVHAGVFVLLDLIGINAQFVNIFVGIPLTVILTIIISFIVVTIIQKIPILKYIIP